jgi:hypothetical protein
MLFINLSAVAKAYMYVYMYTSPLICMSYIIVVSIHEGFIYFSFE